MNIFTYIYYIGRYIIVDKALNLNKTPKYKFSIVWFFFIVCCCYLTDKDICKNTENIIVSVILNIFIDVFNFAQKKTKVFINTAEHQHIHITSNNRIVIYFRPIMSVILSQNRLYSYHRIYYNRYNISVVLIVSDFRNP